MSIDKEVTQSTKAINKYNNFKFTFLKYCITFYFQILREENILSSRVKNAASGPEKFLLNNPSNTCHLFRVTTLREKMILLGTIK